MHRVAGGRAESNSPQLLVPHSPAPAPGAGASTAHSRSVPMVRGPDRPRGLPPCASPRVVSPWWKPREVCVYPARSAPPRPAPTSKMVALQSGRGLRPLVSGRCGLDGRVEVRAPLWVSPLTVPTDAVLEPGSAVHLARPAYLRGLLQGERSMGNSRPGGLAPGVGDMTWGSPLVSGRGKSWPRFFSEPGGPSPSGQGEQASDLRGSACASLHRPPQGLAVTAHR